jgi:enolase-phosphatase E1
MIQCIITDIEGTTTPLSFVKEVLFPFALPRIKPYIMTHQCHDIIEETRAHLSLDASVDACIHQLEMWAKADVKISPLKKLQGRIWAEGYKTKAYTAPIYDDVLPALTAWKDAKKILGIYSSGSIMAQHLLWEHTTQGNIRPLFTHFFDTSIGAKIEPSSYERIATTVGILPQNILFLSDALPELTAAKEAGYTVIGLCRDNAPPLPIPFVRSFEDIQL